MQTNSPDTRRISTDFAIPLVFLGIVTAFLLLSFLNSIIHHEFDGSASGMLVFILVSLLLMGYLFTRKRVVYDFAQCVLYVSGRDGQNETAIPVQRIEKILFSLFAIGRGSSSYIIVYRDENDQQQKFRLFTRTCDDAVNTLMKDAKAANPDLVCRNWSVGINEFFD